MVESVLFFRRQPDERRTRKHVIVSPRLCWINCMATVTLILGYCCSGKTHLADEMVKTLGVRKFDENFLNDMGQHTQLIEALRNNIDCVVIEIEYCLDKPRQAVIQKLKRKG